VYERDLQNNRDLIGDIDQQPSKAYKRSGDRDIAGNIATVDDEESVQWASTLPGYADGYRPSTEQRTAMCSIENAVREYDHSFSASFLMLLSANRRTISRN
jgi:hypothetical protein